MGLIALILLESLLNVFTSPDLNAVIAVSHYVYSASLFLESAFSHFYFTKILFNTEQFTNRGFATRPSLFVSRGLLLRYRGTFYLELLL